MQKRLKMDSNGSNPWAYKASKPVKSEPRDSDIFADTQLSPYRDSGDEDETISVKLELSPPPSKARKLPEKQRASTSPANTTGISLEQYENFMKHINSLEPRDFVSVSSFSFFCITCSSV